MTEWIENLKVVLAIGALIGGAFWGRSKMIRRSSQDKVAVAEGDGHVDILDVLRAERTELAERNERLTKERDDAMREHAKAMFEIGGLRKEVEHLTSRIADQSRQILDQSTKIESLERTVSALNDQIKSLMGLRDIGLPPVPKE